MIYISYDQLVHDVLAWDEELPRDIDAVCAIPRSGNIPSSLLALHRNIQWTTVEALKSGLFLGGNRNPRHRVRKVLVLDDSMLSGKAMNAARMDLDGLDLAIEYAVVYAKPGTEHLVDYLYKEVELPRLFEWNVFHGYWAKQACFDIDGVLCRDPTDYENDDGPRYELFLKTATPRYIPSVRIPAIVTSRLERYRPQTVSWLRQHRVDYDKLFMHPARNKKERIREGNHALRKAEVYKDVQYKLFIESSKQQAITISKLSKKPVLCTDMNDLYGG